MTKNQSEAPRPDEAEYEQGLSAPGTDSVFGALFLAAALGAAYEWWVGLGFFGALLMLNGERTLREARDD